MKNGGGFTAADIKSQEKHVRALFDKVRNLQIVQSPEIPLDVYGLLDTDECTYIQKLFIICYCLTAGNFIESCRKSGVTISMYKSWIGDKRFKVNRQFINAKQDVDLVFNEMALSELKKGIVNGNEGLLKYYLSNFYPQIQKQMSPDENKGSGGDSIPVYTLPDEGKSNLTAVQAANKFREHIQF